MAVRIATLTGTRDLLRRHGLHVKKGLGQHFMIDEGILNKMVTSAGITKEEMVVEIGPGIGCLTQCLAERAGRVIAVEVDRSLQPVLHDGLGQYDNIDIAWGDVLAIDLETVVAEKMGVAVDDLPFFKVVANLPYYITTPIIMTLLEKYPRVAMLVVMIQKEVAERIVAGPGGKDYGVLSIAAQYHAETSLVTLVPPAAFYPPPEVESAVIKLVRRQVPPVSVVDEKFFFQVVRSSFGQRRKTLLNSLGTLGLGLTKDIIREVLDRVGIDPRRRAETLNLEEFASLTNGLFPHIAK